MVWCGVVWCGVVWCGGVVCAPRSDRATTQHRPPTKHPYPSTPLHHSLVLNLPLLQILEPLHLVPPLLLHSLLPLLLGLALALAAVVRLPDGAVYLARVADDLGAAWLLKPVRVWWWEWLNRATCKTLDNKRSGSRQHPTPSQAHPTPPTPPTLQKPSRMQ